MSNMKAAVVHEAGGPEVLCIEAVPIPRPRPGEVLIKVKAFGLNRSELFIARAKSAQLLLNVLRSGRHQQEGRLDR